ncbi:HypC/HybG/HupF family hydrogenase formation chaperone [Nannocystaceae bacterium ST9]
MCLGVPGQVVAIVDRDRGLASVDVCGVRRQINLACIVDDEHPIDACVGDWVLIHVGFALSRIDAAEAEASLALLDRLGELASELDALRGRESGP